MSKADRFTGAVIHDIQLAHVYVGLQGFAGKLRLNSNVYSLAPTANSAIIFELVALPEHPA